MTREETIEFGKLWMQMNEDCKDSLIYTFFKTAIKALEQEPVYYPPCIDCNKKMDEIRKAYDNMTTKALEQESVIDKIRTEIIQLIQNGVLKIESGNKALFNIIDKYKAESEPQESEGV